MLGACLEEVGFELFPQTSWSILLGSNGEGSVWVRHREAGDGAET